MGQLTVVVGGQYGSEGKGAIAAHIGSAERNPYTRVHYVRVAGPNAGHTVWGKDSDGSPYEYKLRQVPVGAVSNPHSRLYLAAGSEIDPPVLADELELLDAAGYAASARLVVDNQATIIETRHKEAEGELVGKIGSTGKGIGAARAERLLRQAQLAGGAVETAASLRAALAADEHVIIEGTQGYGLGLHAGMYPFCTSSDCRAIDFLSMAGLSSWFPGVSDLSIVVVARTYPIRVAGNSGPLEGETSWEALGQPEERTTVTNKVRRVGAWDPDLIRAAVLANGGPASNVTVALTMFDYVFPALAGRSDLADLTEEHWAFIHKVESEANAEVQYIGTSPTTVIRRL